MSKTYARLTEDERYQIYEGIVHGASHRVIVKQLGRSPSTVSRTVVRNKGLRGYRPVFSPNMSHDAFSSH